MTNKTDYSQNGEQEAIFAAFEGESHIDRRFLDIGAWNPRTFSNTRALYEAGWSGLMVEPSPAPMRTLIEAYGHDDRVELLQAAVDVSGEPILKMKISDDGVSTSDFKHACIWRNSFVGSIYVPTISLERIALQFGGFDFWDIDAEGASADICLAMLRLEYRPRCICVEHDDRAAEILQAATAVGYKCTAANSTNLVMVR